MHDIIKNWETDVIDCPSTSVAKKIAVLRGGESITIKSLGSTSNYHYVGTKHMAELSRGYKLLGTKTMTLSLPASFGRDNCIEIYALPTNAGDDVTYFKLLGRFPTTFASS